MIELRSYQAAAVDNVRSLRGRFRIGLESPTGSGKTVIMAELLRDPRRQLVISHRRVLLDQLSKVLKSFGIAHGFRASGHKPKPTAPIQLAMVQTELKRAPRAGLAADIDVLHIDEIHCQRGPGYRRIFDQYHAAGASVIGYTATPSDMGGMVDSVYRVASVPELIELGYLCPPRVFSCGQPDVDLLEKLRRDAQGEYLAADVNKIIKPHVIFGRVLEHYRRLNPDGRPFVLFAHSVKASIWWAQSLTSKGVPVAHIDGDNVWVDGEFYKSDSTKRAECFKRLENGELKGVSNRFVLREGWDCSFVGHAILTCPMASRKTFVQACGRVLRPFPGREYNVIQDHSGSCVNHPALDSDEPWDWQSPPGLSEKVRIAEIRNDTTPEPIICPQCMGVRNAGDTCPYCGFRYAKHARYVIQSDGTLRLVEGKAFRPRKVSRRPTDENVWASMYWGAKKNKPNRTFEQLYAYFAFKNKWRWLPRDLPLQPLAEADWFLPVGGVPASRLRSKESS